MRNGELRVILEIVPFDVTALAESLASSPWFFVALLVTVAVDAVVPLVPGEVLLTVGGALVATESSEALVTVIAVGAAGALLGDLIAFRVGRGGQRFISRIRPGSRSSALLARMTDALERRGTAMLIGARFVPGGRTAATMAAGLTGFPLRRLVMVSTASSLGWATYTTLLGYAGGTAFDSHPLFGALLGVIIGLLVGMVLSIITARPSTDVARVD